MTGTPEYEVHAIEYGRHAERLVFENFTAPLPPGFDQHDAPMPMSFFAWVLRSGERVIAVDTGYDAAAGSVRGRDVVLPMDKALQALGIDRARVTDVVITHMHWDHAGNHGLYPNARYHLQAREMSFCTGPCMCHPTQRRPYSADDVAAMLHKIYSGRVQFHDGTAEIAPGVHVHLVGGHSRGLQVATVGTRRGTVVLASDAAHYYANYELEHPFPIIDRQQEMLDGFRLIRRLSASPAHFVPGHDPGVLHRYPPSLGRDLPGIVRLDAAPRDAAPSS